MLTPLSRVVEGPIGFLAPGRLAGGAGGVGFALRPGLAAPLGATTNVAATPFEVGGGAGTARGA